MYQHEVLRCPPNAQHNPRRAAFAHRAALAQCSFAAGFMLLLVGEPVAPPSEFATLLMRASHASGPAQRNLTSRSKDTASTTNQPDAGRGTQRRKPVVCLRVTRATVNKAGSSSPELPRS